MKIISIEEHFVTHEITTAWENSAIGHEGTGSFDQGEIGRRLEDLGEADWHYADFVGSLMNRRRGAVEWERIALPSCRRSFPRWLGWHG